MLLGLAWLAAPPSAISQIPAEAPATQAVRAERLIDVRTGRVIRNAVILIEGERITAVGANLPVSPDVRVTNLGDVTLLPGLIDAHSHLVARRQPGVDFGLMLLTKSRAFRALEGAANARLTLWAGFTTVRDLGSEGAGYADVDLRDAIELGLVQGPRMQVSTRTITAYGTYAPTNVSPDILDFPAGAQMVTGSDQSRQAAREQIRYGADLLKLYADRPRQPQAPGGVRFHPTLTVEEMRAVVEAAHQSGRRVAAHAWTAEGIRNAVRAGVDAIEHGWFADDEALELMRERGVTWVPTIGWDYFEALSAPDSARRALHRERVEFSRRALGRAREMGIPVAAGWDAVSVPSQGRNMRELLALHELGFSPIETIRSATVVAAELMGWDDRVGTLEPGRFADIIAVAGDPLTDMSAMERLVFVMKGGVIVRAPGSD